MAITHVDHLGGKAYSGTIATRDTCICPSDHRLSWRKTSIYLHNTATNTAKLWSRSSLCRLTRLAMCNLHHVHAQVWMSLFSFREGTRFTTPSQTTICIYCNGMKSNDGWHLRTQTQTLSQYHFQNVTLHQTKWYKIVWNWHFDNNSTSLRHTKGTLLWTGTDVFFRSNLFWKCRANWDIKKSTPKMEGLNEETLMHDLWCTFFRTFRLQGKAAKGLLT